MDPPGKEEEGYTSMEEQTKTESEGAPESLALVKFSGFSRSAIDSLKEVLLGEDDDTESKKRRSIYMKIAINSCASNGIDEGWLRLDTKAKDDDDDGLSPRLSPSCVFPPQLQDVEDYGCAAWDSRIIIAGGWFVQKIRLSNKVYVYDTDTEEWDQLPPMIAERGSDPVVAVADDIIFVFDGKPQHDDIWGVGEDLAHSKIQLWAEYYDSKSQNPSWKCFPKLPPIELLQYPALSSYALYTKGSLIFFYIGRVVSFNYSTWDWIIYDVGDHPIAKCLKCVEWSAAAVVIDHFLFWYDNKTIYGHDLSMSEGGVILPVFSFDGTSNFCYPMHNFRGITFRSDETYLVRVGGKNELCLFWYEKKYTIRYFIFRVQICLGAATLRLVLTQTGLLESMVSYVERALEVSSRVSHLRVANHEYQVLGEIPKDPVKDQFARVIEVIDAVYEAGPSAGIDAIFGGVRRAYEIAHGIESGPSATPSTVAILRPRKGKEKAK